MRTPSAGTRCSKLMRFPSQSSPYVSPSRPTKRTLTICFFSVSSRMPLVLDAGEGHDALGSVVRIAREVRPLTARSDVAGMVNKLISIFNACASSSARQLADHY